MKLKLANCRRAINMGKSFGGNPEEECNLYCMDGCIPGVKDLSLPKLNKEVGFSSFPCCDFFALKEEGKVVALVEATRALDIKAGIRENRRYSRYIPWKKFTKENNFSDEEIEEIEANVFREYLTERCLRKMLSSMAMLSRVAVICDAPELCADSAPKYNFYLVIHLPPPGEEGKHDGRALDVLGWALQEKLQQSLAEPRKNIILGAEVVVGGRLAERMREEGFA